MVKVFTATGHSFISWLIKRVTGSNVTHCGFIYEPGDGTQWVAHSTKGGVQIWHPKELRSHYSNIEISELPNDPEIDRMFLTHLSNQVLLKYDYPAFIRAGLAVIFKTKKDIAVGKNAVLCTEFVGILLNIYSKEGKIDWRWQSPSFLLPHEVNDWMKKKGSLTSSL